MRFLAGMGIFFAFWVTATAMAQEPGSLNLTSPAFKHQKSIPERFTCHGEDINPELDIARVPEGSKSLALIVDDPDAPEGVWVHWVVYNIPPGTLKLVEQSTLGTEGLSDYGAFSYHGPCPSDKRIHHYSFRIYALKEKLDINEGSIKSDLEKAMNGKIIAQAELVGTYKNSSESDPL